MQFPNFSNARLQTDLKYVADAFYRNSSQYLHNKCIKGKRKQSLKKIKPIQLLPHPGPRLLQVHTHYSILQINASLQPIGGMCCVLDWRSLVRGIWRVGWPQKIENSVIAGKWWGNYKMISLLLFLILSTLSSSDAQKPEPKNTLCACAFFFIRNKECRWNL